MDPSWVIWKDVWLEILDRPWLGDMEGCLVGNFEWIWLGDLEGFLVGNRDGKVPG